MLNLVRSTPRRVATVLVAAAFLTACGGDTGTKETVGTLLGGVGGAVAGAQFGKGTGQLAAVAAGTIVGALLGSELGKSLDRADKTALQSTTTTALERNPVGQPTSWRNPDSGNYGTVTPVRTYQESSGLYCREYEQTIVVGGERQSAYGNACRQPDGSWKIVN